MRRDHPTDVIGPPSRQLSALEHLEELRMRLIVCLGCVVLASCLSFCFADRILIWLKRPAGTLLPRLAYFSPTEGLVAYVKMAIVCGLVLSLPVMLYQLWAFVRPALTWRERSYGLAFVWWGSLLFSVGAALAYFLFLPLFLRFLLGIGSAHLEPVISVNHYLSFVLGMIVFCGVLFEMPMLIFMLAKLGIVTPEMLRRRRSVALLGLMIVAAVVTPTTDAVSLILMTAPLVVLYEISIVVSSWAARSS